MPRARASTMPSAYPSNAADEREKQLLGNKKRADGAMARAQRLHQPNFRAPFEHRRRGSCAHGERRGKQCGDRHQPHQAADARQNPALAFGDLPDRAHFDARQFLLHLVRDRGDVRAAIPAVVFDRSHRGGIALGESVRGFRQRAHQQAPVLAGPVRQILRDLPTARGSSCPRGLRWKRCP